MPTPTVVGLGRRRPRLRVAARNLRRSCGAASRSCDGLCGLALGVVAGREIRPAAESLVPRRPLLAGAELLLEAVEAAELAAEVVDHVHERRLARAWYDGAAVLERAVVAEDDVEQGLGQIRRKAVQPLDRAAHTVIAERDLAVQAAGVRHRDPAGAELVGLELADVVEQRAGDRDIAVDAR